MSAALIDAPYSSPDARGRCIRHPTIQMSRKKKLGGWKKIIEHCPMCAMEQCGAVAGVGGGGLGNGAYCGEIAPASSHGPMEPSYGGDYGESSSHSGNHHSRNSTQRSSRSRPHSSRSSRPSHHYEGDDRSVDNKSLQSTRSAPSTYGSPTYHRRNSEESSCDTTVDMSQSSSSDHSGSRHSRNGSSRGAPRSGGSVHSHTSRGSRRSARSARSSNSSHRPQQRPSQQARNQISPNQEAFVCGMSYRFDNNRGYYTGQIHVESQLPHGLGSLRSEENGIIEGEWEFGRLVTAGHPASRSPQQDYQEQEYSEEYGCQDYSEYCLPCTSNSPKNSRASSNQATPQDLCNNFGQLGLNEDSNSIAETIDDSEESDFDSSQSSADDWSKGSRNSYSARESKAALPSRNSNSRSSGASSSRFASRSSASSPPHQQKLTEYSSYIEQCDSSQDWYVENDSPQHSRSSSINSSGSASRVSFADDVKREFGSGAGRRVRFR